MPVRCRWNIASVHDVWLWRASDDAVVVRWDESEARTWPVLIGDACLLVAAAVNHVIGKLGTSPTHATTRCAPTAASIVKQIAQQCDTGRCWHSTWSVPYQGATSKWKSSGFTVSIWRLSTSHGRLLCEEVLMMPRTFLVKTSERTPYDVMTSLHQNHDHHHQHQGQDTGRYSFTNSLDRDFMTTYGKFHFILLLVRKL